MVEIKEYNEKYAREMAEMIYENLYKVNIKDYDEEYIDKIAKHFTEEEIKKKFHNRLKCFVALDNDEVIGTASIDKFLGEGEEEGKYIILTVFVKVARHKEGIGKRLIKEIEKFTKSIGAKKLVVPASIYGCDFYRKLGYNYINGKKELNLENEYMLIKNIE